MDIIFDIDGTVADLTHRLHHIKEAPKDWPSFDKAMGDDTVIEPVFHMYQTLVLSSKNKIIFASGRSDRNRDKTIKWLFDNGFGVYHALYMRKEGDYRKDTIVKQELLAEMREDGYDPKICFDDRLSVSKMWAENGVFCFCVNQGLKDF